MSLTNRLALVEGAGAVEDIFAPREFRDFTELFLGEVDAVERRILLDSEEVLTHQGTSQLVMHRTVDAASEHELGNALAKIRIIINSDDDITTP